jgi:hypothetical protein
VRRVSLLAVVLCAACACRSEPPPSVQAGAGAQAVGWRKVGSWSGRGNLQTDSFESVSGQLRIRWRATNGPSSGDGSFRLTAHSAISGRPLQVAVDRQGAGEGTAFVDQDPHVFYMSVESAKLDWSFTVEEAISGTIQGVPSTPGR